MIRTFLDDLRVAARGLRRSPAFAVVAALTLALGTGAATAIFSVVNGVLLSPLPYASPDRLLAVWASWDDTPRSGLSPAEFLDYRRRLEGFEELGVWAVGSLSVTGEGEPLAARTGFVSASLFPTLGVGAARGRTFSEEEDRPDASGVVVVSDGFWRTRLGSDPGVVGRRLVLDGEPATVVGVMAPGFRLPEDFAAGTAAELYVPLGLDPAEIKSRGSHFLEAVGRLAPGVSVEAGLASLRRLAALTVTEFPGDYPSDMGFTAGGRPLRDSIVGSVRKPLLLLLAGVGVVLLVACANVAGLVLARAEERRREIAVRAALGAGRRRLASLLLADAALLALAGGFGGIVLAGWATSAARAWLPADLPLAGDITVDLRVLGFALAVSALTAALCGLLPASAASRLDLNRALHGTRGTLGTARQRARGGLVVGQVGLAVMLLVLAGLLGRSFARLLSEDPGYVTRGVLTADLSLPEAGYAEPGRVRAFYAELTQRLAALPGVRAAAAVSNLPLATDLGDLGFVIEGRALAPDVDGPDADWQVMTPGYFETMGMTLLRGRAIQPSDDARAPGAVVINEALARRHWPGEDALGKRFTLGAGAGPGTVTVVGIVGDVRHEALGTPPRPEMYLPHAQFHFWDGGGPVQSMSLVVRALGEPAELVAAVRREIRTLDPALPIEGFATMEQVTAASVAQPRFTAAMLGVFAAATLLLAAVGLYGLIAYAVARRTREIGLRVALGARGADVLRLLVRQALVLAGTGVALGVPLALAASRAVRSLLYETAPGDPLTLAAVPVLLLIVALLAALAPGRRALRVEPMAALRSE